MTREEFDELNSYLGLVTINDLQDKEDRLLLHGYTMKRNTFDLYLENGMFVKRIDGKVYGDGDYEDCEDYMTTPDGLKRLYPAKCDYEFCKLLLDRDVYLPFTTF